MTARTHIAAAADEVRISVDGKAGRILLDRPQALNAVTQAMVLAIEAALLEWAHDDRIALVIIEGAGDKAFSAGGDIQALYRDGTAGNFAAGQAFWRDEYRLNRRIRRYPKPYVALMDGIVMGGGAGVSVHGSHRIVTERAMVAMPECAIGLVPDVGVSLVLATAPGRLGEYLALTGARMGPGEAIHAGFADHYMPSAKLAGLVERLAETGDVGAVAQCAAPPPPSSFADLIPAIDAFFAAEDGLAIVRTLEADSSPFTAKAAQAMRRASPLSLASTLKIIRAVRTEPTIEAALAAEYRFTYRAQGQGDFIEGIRAAVIDKDRSPRWSPGRLEDLSPAAVDAMTATLGPHELTFSEDIV